LIIEEVRMSAEQQFLLEYQKWANRNGVPVSANKVGGLLRAEIADGARFVNVFREVENKKAILVVTTLATHSVRVVPFSLKLEWSVRHEEVDEVYTQQQMRHGYLVDELVLDTDQGSYTFWFGFCPTGTAAKWMRDMAKHNADAAAQQIEAQIGHRDALVDEHRDAPVEETSIDLDLARFHRGRALAKAGPAMETESCAGWKKSNYEELFAWLASKYNKGDDDAVWARRCALGVNLGQGEADRDDWFWINAFPALSGLALDQRDNVFLAVCAGYADQAVDRSDPDEVEAMETIEQGMFGRP
jgi:hypothetical protein